MHFDGNETYVLVATLPCLIHDEQDNLLKAYASENALMERLQLENAQVKGQIVNDQQTHHLIENVREKTHAERMRTCAKTYEK